MGKPTDCIQFVRDHPKYLKTPLYVIETSYSRIIILLMSEGLYKDNDKGLEPVVNIQGYMSENPLTDKTGDINCRLEYAYRSALISEIIHEATKKDCNGDYADVGSNNLRCTLDIDEVNKVKCFLQIELIV